MRTVRVVSRLFTPEVAAGSFRLRAIAEGLTDLGTKVEVITTTPPAGLPIDDRGLRVRRWPVLRDEGGNVRGYFQYLSFDIPLVLRLIWRRADLTVVEPPPTTGAVVRVICTLQRRPYVYYAGDVWTDGVIAMGAPAIVVTIIRILESWVAKGASTVLCVNEPTAERIGVLGVPEARRVVVGNGVDTNIFGPEVTPEERATDFIYTGTMSEWQGADIFVDGLLKVREQYPDARMSVFAKGSALSEMRSHVERECPAAVDFYDVIPPEECARWIRGAKASLASIKPHIGYDFAKPTKIFAAAACGTPVIFAGIGAGQEVVTDEDLGWAPGYDADAIAEAMLAALRQTPEEARERSRRCAEWALENASLKAQGRTAALAALESVG